MADENPYEHGIEELHVVCLDYLLDQHPESGVGMRHTDQRRRRALRVVELDHALQKLSRSATPGGPGVDGPRGCTTPR
jgi:hypothetical protein